MRTLILVRVLSPQTVAVMTWNQTDTLYSSTGQGFGLGFSTLERLGADTALSTVRRLDGSR